MKSTPSIATLQAVKSMRDVLRECFQNDPARMREAAEYFVRNGRPPNDLGRPYQVALGSRPRGKWWLSVLKRLNDAEASTAMEVLECDVDSIARLAIAWDAVAQGREVILLKNGRRFARVVLF
jgi:hypothetical protein